MPPGGGFVSCFYKMRHWKGVFENTTAQGRADGFLKETLPLFQVAAVTRATACKL